MAAAAAIRSARSSIPSSGIRNVASKISAGGARNPAASGSPLRSLNQKPLLSHRSIFRSPVELSSCVETTLPYHTATASALLTSMLSATPRTYGWPLEDH